MAGRRRDSRSRDGRDESVQGRQLGRHPRHLQLRLGHPGRAQRLGRYAKVYSIAGNYIKGFESNLGANTVRLPINEPSVSQSWWGRYRGAIDAALHDKMKVILSYWSQRTSVGTITNMSAWKTMWDTADSDYGSNPNVYFEPMNEPYGYTLSQWVSICSGWLAAHSAIPRDRVIISGTGYNAYLTGVGAASALKGTLLSLHFYPGWASYTQEPQWQSDIL
jgi:hypothetical protein